MKLDRSWSHIAGVVGVAIFALTLFEGVRSTYYSWDTGVRKPIGLLRAEPAENCGDILPEVAAFATDNPKELGTLDWIEEAKILSPNLLRIVFSPESPPNIVEKTIADLKSAGSCYDFKLVYEKPITPTIRKLASGQNDSRIWRGFLSLLGIGYLSVIVIVFLLRSSLVGK